MSDTPLHLVALSGSLRAESTNSALVRAWAASAPGGARVTVYDGLAGLPHFSPDLDGPPLGPAPSAPPPVQALRALLASAGGVVIGTPEYAFGIPGSLKNALDWLVPSGELWRLPVVIFSASPSAGGGQKAFASLRLTLTALEADVVDAGSFTLPFARSKVSGDGRVSDPETAETLKSSAAALVRAIEDKKRAQAEGETE